MAFLSNINSIAQTPSSLLNFIANSDNSQGWSGVTATLTTNTTSSFIPAYPSRTTSIKVDVTSTNGYGATSFTVPAGVGELVGISFYYMTNDTTASNWTIELWQGATQITLPTSSLVSTTTGLNFNSSVTLTKGQTYNLRFKSAAASKQIYLSGVTVGTSVPVQGAAISNSVTWTPTGSWTANTTYTGDYQRVGSTGNFHVRVSLSGAPTAATLTVNMPSGLTIDSSLVSVVVGTNTFGKAHANANGVAMNFSVVSTGSTSTVQLYFQSTASSSSSAMTGVSNTSPISWTTPSTIDLYWSVPIAEWAGNGTVNLGAGAQVEYASNSTAWGTDNSSAFQYGPAGATITGSLAANLTQRVRFQYPIQVDDVVTLELKYGGNNWVDIGQTNVQYSSQNTAAYGARLSNVAGSNTDFDVVFQQYAVAGTAYGSTGGAVNWNTGVATAWRVRKAKASAPVGFGLAGTDGSSGLYKPGQAPGLATGAAIAAGYVGEQPTKYSSSSNVSLATTMDTFNDVSGATLTLQPGVWIITAQLYLQFTTSVGGTPNIDGLIGEVAIRTGSTTVALTSVAKASGNTTYAFGSAPVQAAVNISVATTYKISTYLRTINTAVTASGVQARGDYFPTTLSAVRIA